MQLNNNKKKKKKHVICASLYIVSRSLLSCVWEFIKESVWHPKVKKTEIIFTWAPKTCETQK